MHEVDKPRRTMRQRHPDLGAYLTRCGFALPVDIGTLDAVPDGLALLCPLSESVYPLWHQSERQPIGDRVDIIGDHIAPLHVGFIVVQLRARAAPYPFIVRDSLPQVEQNWARGVCRL